MDPLIQNPVKIWAALERLIKADSALNIAHTAEPQWTRPVEQLKLDKKAQTLSLLSLAPWPAAGLDQVILSGADGQSFLVFKSLALVEQSEDEAPGDPRVRHFQRPKFLEVINRRQDIRFRLPQGKTPVFTIANSEQPLTGFVSNLSMGGCLVKLPTASVLTLKLHQPAYRFTIVFPNGAAFKARGRFKHFAITNTPGIATAGISFCELPPQTSENLRSWVSEIELEVAALSGHQNHWHEPSKLLKANRKTQQKPQDLTYLNYATLAQKPLQQIAHNMAKAALALKTDQDLPIEALILAASELCKLAQDHPNDLFVSTTLLSNQPPFIQHSLSVAARLIDLLGVAKVYTPDQRFVAMALLIHELYRVWLIERPRGHLSGHHLQPTHHQVEQFINILTDYKALKLDFFRHFLTALISPRYVNSGGY